MKRIIAALLAALCILPLAACAANPATADTTAADTAAAVADTTAAPEETTAEEDPLLHDSLGEYNFDGAEYRIFGTSYRTTTAVTAEEQNGEAINDAQYLSRTNVEERFNVNIKYEDIGTDDDSVINMMKQLVNGGDDTYALGIGIDTGMINLGMQGFHYNLKKIPQFDFEQPWWGEATKELAFGDKYYTASSFITYYCLYYVRMLVVNKDLASDLNLTIPYDKVFAGEWYLDDYIEFISTATQDLNGDGVMTEEDQFGFVWDPGTLYTFQNSMGVSVFQKDENNMPVVNFNMDKALKYLEKMEPVLQNYTFKHDADYGAPIFAQNKALTVYCNLREVCNFIRDTEIIYGYLPAPKLDEDQKEYKTVAPAVLWGVPSIHDGKLEMIGAVTEALSCQHYNYVRPAFFDTTMKGKLSDSPEDAQVLDLIPGTRSIDFGFSYQKVITAMETLRDLTEKLKSSNLASTYKKLSTALDKQLKTTVEKMEKLES